MQNSGNPVDSRLLSDGLQALHRVLPPGWTVGAPQANGAMDASVGVPVRAPDASQGELQIRLSPRLDPKGAMALATQQDRVVQASVVVSHYLSAMTRSRLRDRGFGYLDLTGNVRIALGQPGLFVETQGATEDPDRTERAARSLRGAKAGRIVRALVDFAELPTVRVLAERTGTDPGYVSRVLSLLDSEALIVRGERGRLRSVDWPNLLRRWAEEAPLVSRARLVTALDPRGLSALLPKLAAGALPYALTGSFAAAALAPVTAGRLAMIWVNDASAALAAWQLRPADSGANVLLCEPEDALVFEGQRVREDLRHAAPSQVVADLLTAPGRGPVEGEALLAWMVEHEDAWRR